MRFTENEMTLAVRGSAAAGISLRAAASGIEGIDAEALLDQMDPFERYQFLTTVGDLVLPVLVALPDVDVEPGTRPRFTIGMLHRAADQVVRAEAEAREITLTDEQRHQAVALRVASVGSALDALPVRIDPDALLTADDIDSVVVPDTIEGI